MSREYFNAYRSVKIEVELDSKTLTFTKDRKKPIGFSTD